MSKKYLSGKDEYSFIRRMRQEEKERNKKLLKYQEENDKWLKDHLCIKKDEDYDINIDYNNNSIKEEKKEKHNNSTKKKKQQELKDFLGYKNKTAFCVAKNYQLFKLNACLEKLNNDKKEINEKNIASYMNTLTDIVGNSQQQTTDFATEDKIQKEKEECRIAKLASNKIIKDAMKKYETKTIEKQQDEIKILQNKLEKLEVMLDKLQQDNIKNRNRIKGLDWYFEKKLTKEKNNTELSLDTEINFVRTNYVKGIYHILALGLLYILINDIIISILRLIK